MPDIVAALDETSANVIVPRALNAISPLTASGSDNLGPFTASWAASATLSNGFVDLIPPPTDVIRITNCRLDYSLNFTFAVDLSFLNFCLPQICVTIPFIGRVCTPRICITFPTITVPVSHSSFLTFSADFRLNVQLSGGNWRVDAVVVGVPFLQLSASAVALLAAVGAAITAALLLVPGIGPLLALAAAAILATIGIAGATGLLGKILTPFVAGLTFNVIPPQPQVFEVLPAAAGEAAVNVTLDSLAATLVASPGEDELRVDADIS
jgi:hypothetical protein